MTDALAPAPADRDVPGAHVGTLAPNYYCRAWNPRREKYCRSRAGASTDHKGVGRCKTHGGGADERVTHGQSRRYRVTTPRIAELLAQFEADEHPLDLLPEVAFLRALVVDYVERYERFSVALVAWHDSFHTGAAEPKPRVILDIADASRLLDRVGLMVKRIEDIRAANAITYPQLTAFLFALERVIEARVTDATIRDAIREDVRAIRVA